MPRFSVIVPTHGVEGRLSLALDSVLSQSFGAFELIPVRDTPDAPAATVIAAYAERDTRVAPVDSPPSAGLSGARNAGTAAATGRYLLFLDGDDTLAPGALAALHARLLSSGEPDVLSFDHERVPWWEGEPTTLRLKGARAPAWSAAYRRAFVTEHQLAFPCGHFTDVGWSGLVTLTAERTAELRSVCVRHLVRRQGSRLDAPGEHQLDLLDQVELVLSRACAEHGLSEALFEQLFAAVLRTAARPGLLPAERRRAFFGRAARLHRRYRPARFRPPAGSLGVQHRLLAAGAYTAFHTLRAAHRTTAKAVRAVPRPRLPRARALYAAHRRRPLDENLAVYRADRGRGYAGDPAAIHAMARRLAPYLRSVFLVEPEAVDALPEGVEYAVIGSPRAWEVLARATYLVDDTDFADADFEDTGFEDTGFEDTAVKRPGSVHLRIQPGTPLTTTGVDLAMYPMAAATAGGFDRLLHRVDRWDFGLSSNRHSTEVWERAFPGAYETLEYGCPRNDVYCTATADDVARVRRELGVPEGRVALLYAPLDARLDLEAFCEAAGEQYVVLLYADHVDDRGGRASSVGGGRIIDVTHHRSAEDVCLAADALVTDHASIMFDYANLDRPIVVYADDWEVCRETRGVYVDLMEAPPGPVARTPDELARLFRDGSYSDAGSAALRATFRERFCQFDDGRAAERVVRRVLLGEPPESIPAVIPIDRRVPAPTPSARTPSPASPASSVSSAS
ncbi:CDP-glycerol glycerophosphotransferase family protein [Streptomyces sp. NPDC046862]|uniref:bifunctional glycosyltransferase/CDP-glycerol:glycerophosphate glycerophosphotransferase n=1 Tax=Streptomyces sp. NPDC046862 TaxID=3154603 RepID=UPI003456A9CF